MRSDCGAIQLSLTCRAEGQEQFGNCAKLDIKIQLLDELVVRAVKNALSTVEKCVDLAKSYGSSRKR